MYRGILRSSRCLSNQSSCRYTLQSLATPRYFSCRSSLWKEEDSGKSNDDSDFSLLSPESAKKESSTILGSSSGEATPLPGSAQSSASASASSKPNKDAKDEKAQRKAQSQSEATSAWTEIMKTLNMSNKTSSSFIDTSGLHTPASNEPLDPKTSFEQQWKVRQLNGPITPARPKDGRTVEVKNDADLARSYGALTSIISRNNIKYELRLGDRYEKPNQTRRRLKSERHRRRFAEAVREKVRLVMELKSRGA